MLSEEDRELFFGLAERIRILELAYIALVQVQDEEKKEKLFEKTQKLSSSPSMRAGQQGKPKTKAEREQFADPLMYLTEKHFILLVNFIRESLGKPPIGDRVQ